MLRMDDNPPETRPHAAQAARAANSHILALEDLLAPRGGDEQEIGFFCECGCLGVVAMTRAEYEAAGGAWLAGHKPD
jgi:hypothetical protein